MLARQANAHRIPLARARVTRACAIGRGDLPSILVSDAKAEWRPGACVSCDAPLGSAGDLYCSIQCHDIAKVIRYTRATAKDGRLQDPEVVRAIGKKIAHALSGGYDEAARRVPASIRAEVLSANGGICMICQREPAVQVDHIAGPSGERKNLQGLCARCHDQKTEAAMVPIAPDDVTRQRLHDEIRMRAEAPSPVRPCDDEDVWRDTWREIRASNRQHFWDQAVDDPGLQAVVNREFGLT